MGKVKNNSPNKNANSKQKAQKLRASNHYFKHFVNEHNQQLLTSEVNASKQVPVKINNDSGDVEMHPGWFIVHGDGAEKIHDFDVLIQLYWVNLIM